MASATVTVKPEPAIKPDPDSLQIRILELFALNIMGVTQEILNTAMPQIQFAQIVPILNALQKEGIIEVLVTANKSLVWKMKDPETLEKMKGLDLEEQLVFQAIQNARSSGATTKTILDETKVPRNKVTRIVRSLIKKKRVKEMNAPTGNKQKVYLSFEIEPSPELSWGSFYSGDTGFEEEYVEVLRGQCSLYIENKSTNAAQEREPLARRNATYASLTEIHKYIKDLKISNEELSVRDIMTIMDCLVQDGQAERKKTATPYSSTSSTVDLDDETGGGCYLTGSGSSSVNPDSIYYRRATPLIDACGLVKIPCGACPVRQDCRPGGLIAPETCEYLKEFLQF